MTNKLMEDFAIEPKPDGKCMVRVEPQFPRNASLSLCQAETHRLCAELLEENVSMQENLGQEFKGTIRVDTQSLDCRETGVVIMEAMNNEDLARAVTLAEFVHENTELME